MRSDLWCQNCVTFANSLAAQNLLPPTLRERRHRGLARRLVAVSWRAVFVLAGPVPTSAKTSWRSPHRYGPGARKRSFQAKSVLHAIGRLRVRC